SFPSHDTKQPKCVQIGENACISPSSSLYTHAVCFTSDSYHPSTCSTSQSTLCGSLVISSTDKLTFVRSPDSHEVFHTCSLANLKFGLRIHGAINPPKPVSESFRNSRRHT